jgi:hypothetical protein
VVLPKRLWDRPDVNVWFHYALPDVASAIDATRKFRVPHRPDPRGDGLHLTRVAPDQLPDDELLKRLFALRRDRIAIEGVVVLRRDDLLLPVRANGRSTWLHPRPCGEVLDIAGVYLGFGRREKGVWLWSDGLTGF